MNILGTGLSGMIGSRIVELTHKDWKFENLSLETGVDITQKSVVYDFVARTSAPWVFLFAAYTDVDGAEKERKKGISSIPWLVNVVSTQYFVEACTRFKKRILYISTDYVFDGKKASYREEDEPNPQGWYAVTKFEGEKRVSTLGDQALIIRLANPYRASPSPKLDFVHRIIHRLQTHELVQAPSDQMFIPTFIDDIANAIYILVKSNASGLYHVVGSQVISPYEAAIEIARVWGFSTETISKTKFETFFMNRAPRPLHANLKNDKITKLGIWMKSFSEGIKTVYNQESKQKKQ